MRVDEAPLDTAPGNDELALCRACIRRDCDRLYRFTGETLGKEIAPHDIKTAIGGAKRRHVDCLASKFVDPSPVRTEFRPASAAKGKERSVACDDFNAIRLFNSQALALETKPTMPGKNTNALIFETFYPGA